MHLHWERSANTTGDCSINSLSWMGKVPEEIPEEDGWKLSRNNYYQEGWLATANIRGVVGVTYTTSFSAGGEIGETPARTNYNLRGHRSEVTLVKWNEPYQKLASCDSTGIIFVWIKYEGRWSIELINDRNTPVKSFSWSHDGRMALICYQDGFVLVGSVAGQRYWSTMLPHNATATCGVWTPEDNQVYIGTKQGDMMVMDLHGNPVTRVELAPDTPISSLSWNCEKFNMEEREEEAGQANEARPQTGGESVLAVCYNNGDIDLVRGHDDVSPHRIHTGLQNLYAEWSNSGEFLAVAGRTSLSCSTDANFVNRIKFYRENGVPISTVVIPSFKSPVTALTWGHNDKRLFVATGPQVHIGWVNRRIGSLQLLCRLKIHKTLKFSNQVDFLPLPCRVKNLISSLFTQSIKCHIPDRKNLRHFVSRPPATGLRHYCTMIRHGDEFSGPNYTIYLEHLGGFLPILKGRKTSKLRPEFVIFDPSKVPCSTRAPSSSSSFDVSDADTDGDEPTYSPRTRRKKRRRRNQPQYFGYVGNEEVDYINNLPEHAKMVEVSSNIWGTKFKIHGLDLNLPPILGQISYKASLLHLQPRQMRLILTELRDDLVVNHFAGNFGGSNLSEDEDEPDKLTMEDDLLTAVTAAKEFPVVAPLPSLSNRLSIVDFQKISPTRMDFCDPKTGGHTVPELSFTLPPDSPERPVSSKCSSDYSNYSFQASSESEISETCQVQNFKHQGSLAPLVAKIESLSTELETDDVPSKKRLVNSQSCAQHLAGSSVQHQACSSGDRSADCVVESAGISGLRLQRRDSVGVNNNGGGNEMTNSSGAQNSSSSGSSPNNPSPRRWAAKAEELRDPESEWNGAKDQEERSHSPYVRSCSVDHLGAIVDILGVPSDAPLLWENARRLILSAEKKRAEQRRSLANQGKSRSLDNDQEDSAQTDNRILTECRGDTTLKKCSTCKHKNIKKDFEYNLEMFHVAEVEEEEEEEEEDAPLLPPPSPRSTRKFDSVRNLLEKARSRLSRSQKQHSSSSEEHIGSEPGSPVHTRRRLREKLCVPESGGVTQSSPNTPLIHRRNRSNKRHQSFSPVRTLLNSPLLRRKKSSFDSSDEEITDLHHSRLADRSSRPALSGYQNLETFQKQKLRQKLRQLSSIETESIESRDFWSPDSSPKLSPRNARVSPRCGKELVMHNKAPLWNESSQVYQLDFGGRVTQESAKNFQIEYNGKQVMQFGRIDSNAYTLDFQYPFTTLQAFAVALANVTQRLK